MKLFLTKKIGSFRIGAGIKLTWWNFIFIAIGAMVYWMFYLAVLMIELVIMLYYYMFKYLFKGCRFLFRKAVELVDWIIDKIQAKTQQDREG